MSEIRRVAAIGFDAMEWTLVERMVDEGRLPNFEKLLRQGVSARLENLTEYRAEAPWTQFLTGEPARQSQYWTTIRFDSERYVAWDQGAHRGEPFFAHLPDGKAIQFDIPGSAVTTGFDGVQITAWGAHAPQHPRASNPPGLLAEIDDRFGVHRGYNSDFFACWYDPDYAADLTEALVEGAARRISISRFLMEREPDWRLMVMVMSEPHGAGHHFWHSVDPGHPLHHHEFAPMARRNLYRVYEALDAQVGRLADSLPPDTALVAFAVHGMQRNSADLSSQVLLPEFLYRRQFGRALLKGTDPRLWRLRGMPVLRPPLEATFWSYLNNCFADDPSARRRRAVRNALPVRALDTVRAARRRVNGAPPPMRIRDDEIPPEATAEGLAPPTIDDAPAWTSGQVPGFYQRYWPSMPAFALPTFSDAHVRINLKGRESQGMVEPDRYMDAINELVADLRQITNPQTGHSMVEEVILMREDDPMDPEGADSDVCIVWSEPTQAWEHPTVGTVGPFPYKRSGEHSSNGFVAITGPGLTSADRGLRSAHDVPPSILDLLGAPRPDGMVGRSLLDE